MCLASGNPHFVTSFFTTETSNPGVSPETWINSLQTRLLVWQISYLFKMPSFLHLFFFLVFSDLSIADHDMIWNSEKPCQLNWEPSCYYSDRCEDGKYCSTLFKQVNQQLVYEQDRWVYVVFGGCILYKNTKKHHFCICKQDVSLSESLLRAHRSDVIGEVLINVESYHIVHQTNSISWWGEWFTWSFCLFSSQHSW